MYFTIKVDKIPSVNSLYAYNVKTKSKYLTKEGKSYKTRLKQMLQVKTKDLNTQFINDSIELIKNNIVTKEDFKLKNVAYELNVIFFLNSGVLSRDTSNLIKATEDAIFEYLNLNDNRVFYISSEKIYNDLNLLDDSEEMITVILTPIKHVNKCRLSYIINKFKQLNFTKKNDDLNEIILNYIKKRKNYV